MRIKWSQYPATFYPPDGEPLGPVKVFHVDDEMRVYGKTVAGFEGEAVPGRPGIVLVARFPLSGRILRLTGPALAELKAGDLKVRSAWSVPIADELARVTWNGSCGCGDALKGFRPPS